MNVTGGRPQAESWWWSWWGYTHQCFRDAAAVRHADYFTANAVISLSNKTGNTHMFIITYWTVDIRERELDSWQEKPGTGSMSVGLLEWWNSILPVNIPSSGDFIFILLIFQKFSFWLKDLQIPEKSIHIISYLMWASYQDRDVPWKGHGEHSQQLTATVARCRPNHSRTTFSVEQGLCFPFIPIDLWQLSKFSFITLNAVDRINILWCNSVSWCSVWECLANFSKLVMTSVLALQCGKKQQCSFY